MSIHKLFTAATRSLLRQSHGHFLCTATSGGSEMNQGEKKISEILGQHFPAAKTLQVEDISGGCGSMYRIHLESTEFKGLRTLQQHRLIKEALKEQIKDMHGLTITTQAL